MNLQMQIISLQVYKSRAHKITNKKNKMNSEDQKRQQHARQKKKQTLFTILWQFHFSVWIQDSQNMKVKALSQAEFIIRWTNWRLPYFCGINANGGAWLNCIRVEPIANVI